jgi:hypothetical protein
MSENFLSQQVTPPEVDAGLQLVGGIGSTLISAIFFFGSGPNWLSLLFFIAGASNLWHAWNTIRKDSSATESKC